METRPKSQTELNSQAMAFLADEVDDWIEKKHISEMTTKDLGSIAVHELYPQYVDYLRKTRAGNRESIDTREALQQRYDNEFKPIVDALRNTLKDTSNNQGHESYVGEGGASQVFAINSGSKEYIVRNMIHEQADKVKIDQYIAGAMNVKGVPHFEQIVAVSYEDEATVAERMPGIPGGGVTAEGMRGISEQQLRDLVDTLRLAQENDIYIDYYSPNNLMYDTEEGFGLIDLGSTRVKGIAVGGQTHGIKAVQAAEMLLGFGIDSNKYTDDEKKLPEYYEEKRTLLAARLNLLQKFRGTVAYSDMTEKDKETALNKTRGFVESLAATLKTYEDPDYVNREISEAMKWRKSKPGSFESIASIDTSKF